ncbi:MAG: hypothetical protein K2M95_07655, partial [Clostridiales bacterium]|nr:hypothetical protein [Clostridiales bacterium]
MNGILFTETCAVTVIKAPTFGITQNTAGKTTTYALSGVNGLTAEYKLTVKSGSELITLGANSYGDYDTNGANTSFAVTRKDNTNGGTAVLVFSMRITSGVYNGVVVEQTETITIDAFAMSVSEAAAAANGHAYTVGTQNAASETYKMEVLSGADLITLGESASGAYATYGNNNAFTVTPKTDTKGGTVVLLFYVKVANAAGEGDLIRTEQKQFVVDPETAYSGITIGENPAYTYTVQNASGDDTRLTYKMEVTQGANLITLGESASGAYATYGTNNAFTVTPKRDTLGGTVVLTFYAKVAGGAYDGLVMETTKTFTVEAEGEYTGVIATKAADSYTYTLTMQDGESAQKASVRYRMEVLSGGDLITLGANTNAASSGVFTLSPKTNVTGGKVTLAFYAVITSGAYAGAEFVTTESFNVAALSFTVTGPVGNVYTAQLSGIAGGETPSYNMTVLSGADLISLGGSYASFGAGHEFTVTPNGHTKGGKVVLVFKGKVTVSGKDIILEQTVSFDIEAEEEYTGISVTKSGNTYTVAATGSGTATLN